MKHYIKVLEDLVLENKIRWVQKPEPFDYVFRSQAVNGLVFEICQDAPDVYSIRVEDKKDKTLDFGLAYAGGVHYLFGTLRRVWLLARFYTNEKEIDKKLKEFSKIKKKQKKRK